MSPIEFGELAQCRTCHGTGLSRNPQWGDKDLARERQRVRRRGGDVEKPRELITCAECHGEGFIRPRDADRARDDRTDLQAVSVIGPRR